MLAEAVKPAWNTHQFQALTLYRHQSQYIIQVNLILYHTGDEFPADRVTINEDRTKWEAIRNPTTPSEYIVIPADKQNKLRTRSCYVSIKKLLDLIPVKIGNTQLFYWFLVNYNSIRISAFKDVGTNEDCRPTVIGPIASFRHSAACDDLYTFARQRALRKSKERCAKVSAGLIM